MHRKAAGHILTDEQTNNYGLTVNQLIPTSTINYF